ncbi:hypothetical protein [Agromyces humi]|uniref:hypothetical protein n=1 Tax=Agromyces humi TaxID=1766800 RepID=UPI00135AC428|nr:hypothetical protein [Agromyces humi]
MTAGGAARSRAGDERHLALIQALQRHSERGGDGRFIEATHTSPDISLAPGGNLPDLDELLFGNVPAIIEPRTHADLETAAAAVDLAPAGQIPLLHLCHQLERTFDVELAGPADGRPLIVNVATGSGWLRVTSGYVVTRIDSRTPVKVTVACQSDVTVIIEPGRAASVTVDDGAAATVHVGEGARGLLHVTGQADVNVLGDTRNFRRTALAI